MKKVLTVGVYDLFHYGHLQSLKKARKLGDHLTVAVHDDVERSKGIDFIYSLEQRMEVVASLSFVDEVISYKRVDQLIGNVDFDVFAHGADQNHEYFQHMFSWCHQNGIELVTVPRTFGISSTQMRHDPQSILVI
ncbi:MAG: adenylyltransferase/cytidyltransferase family protein [Balneolales bacterium]|nr:adenylyltransferase/cytidyltransferase family protein [Balneolales bacterium]